MLNLLGRLLCARFFDHPILIVGTGRSGTSVLLQALGRHPKLFPLLGEAPFLTSIGGSAYLFEEQENSRYYLDSLKVSKPYFYHQLKRLGFEAAAGPHYGLKLQIKGLLGYSASPLGRRCWCAKSFPSEKVTSGLMALYPGIRFIYIVRSGLDVVHSRTKFKGFTHQNFRQHCINWAEGVDKYRHLTRLPQAVQVTQEALRGDPQAFFAGILDFLALPASNACADYASTTLVHPLDQTTKTGTNAQDILSRREQAHAHWSDEQKNTFKEICGPGMLELGYDMPF